MAEEQIPQAWVGEDVVVYGLGQATYGRLEGIGEFGLVLRHSTYISWGTGESNEIGEPEWESEYRFIPSFYPWHSVRSLRLQEEEEKREQR